MNTAAIQVLILSIPASAVFVGLVCVIYKRIVTKNRQG